MEIFKAEKIASLLRGLINQLSIGTDDSGPVPKGWRELARISLGDLLPECEALGLVVAAKQIRDAINVLNWGPVRGEQGAMSRAANMIASTVETELSVRLFFFLPADRAGRYNELNPFGDEVASKFPDAMFDIEEASKCFALGRWTASVFHQMRVVEIGLEAFARAIGAQIGNGENWQQTLTAISREINVIESTKPTPDWKERIELYSATAVHIRDIKNAWRNPSMHVRGSYDEDRARDILNATRAFMRHLATEVLK